MEYIKIGKIVNTHGIKGEIRILSDFKFKDKIFTKKFKIYIGDKYLPYIIDNYRKHKQFDMITMDGINNINEVLMLKNKDIYINKADLILNKNEYLCNQILGLKVYIEDKYIGEVVDIRKNIMQEILIIRNIQKDILIPYVFDIIEEIDLINKKIVIKNIEGLI